MLTLGAPITKDLLVPGTCWLLQIGVNGYASVEGDELATQVAANRGFELLTNPLEQALIKRFSRRIRVRLLEDGYKCWLELSDVLGKAINCKHWQPKLLTSEEITLRLPLILKWINKSASKKNKYLWGGTLGPDYDCSGLIQSAFASQEIWLPRDAYQQERFCEKIEIEIDWRSSQLIPGDLLFFGKEDLCNHVAIYRGDGFYWHSSGRSFGNNGIGCDGLNLSDKNPIACHYRTQLRGAGRVIQCHDGRTLP